MPTFTGFWEAHGPAVETELATTISYWPIGRILAALRVRLEAAQPGTHIRVDLITWGEDMGEERPPREETEDEAFPALDVHELKLTDDELDALWRQFVTDGSNIDPIVRLRLIGKVQKLVDGD